MNVSAVEQSKRMFRERIWAMLEREQAVSPGVHGHIPDFVGADAAAERLATLPAWQAARVVKAVPDRAQLPARARALRAGKLVYMAVPMLAHELPFYLLDPGELAVSPEQAASRDVAAQVARSIGLPDMQPVDVVLCGSVAVNRDGIRLGKGAGYSDIEVALLHEAGLIHAQTTILTTVHSLQVVDEPIPEAEHDFRVDVIVTPTEIIRCSSRKRHTRLYWETLSQGQIDSMPVLKAWKT